MSDQKFDVFDTFGRWIGTAVPAGGGGGCLLFLLSPLLLPLAFLVLGLFLGPTVPFMLGGLIFALGFPFVAVTSGIYLIAAGFKARERGDEEEARRLRKILKLIGLVVASPYLCMGFCYLISFAMKLSGLLEH